MSILAQDTIVISPSTVNHIESEIEELRGATDCADVVGTYAELQAYDTSKLTDQAIIKVLQDESQDDAQTYYRYVKSSDSFTLIGELGPYYTKAEDDILLAGKVDKVNTANRIYGTDTNGAQTTYDKEDFGKVDDVRINNTTVVSNKIANITYDDALDANSANAVKNSVVTNAISNKSGVVFRTWND